MKRFLWAVLLLGLGIGLTAPTLIQGGQIANGSVPLAKLSPQAASTLVGNNTGAAASPAALTAAQAKALLALAIADVSGLQTALNSK
ncbi:hypothetical protein OFB83_32025, partial [Escherichia coli]|nr:hypothetical protein [Escherichia coli]